MARFRTSEEPVRRDIHVLRQVVVKVTRMLSARGITVTQRGIKAYVIADKRGRPSRVNLPFIPDNATEELILAIQGFLDHEVAHCLFTDFAIIAKGVKLGKKVKTLHNLLEDAQIERQMRKRFPGSVANLENVYRFLLNEFTKPRLEKATDLGGKIAVLMVPAVRAWAGQATFKEFMTPHWETLEPITLRLADLVERVAKCNSTQDTLDLAVAMIERLKTAAPAEGEEGGEGEPSMGGKSKAKKESGDERDEVDPFSGDEPDGEGAGEDEGDSDPADHDAEDEDRAGAEHPSGAESEADADAGDDGADDAGEGAEDEHDGDLDGAGEDDGADGLDDGSDEDALDDGDEAGDGEGAEGGSDGDDADDDDHGRAGGDDGDGEDAAGGDDTDGADDGEDDGLDDADPTGEDDTVDELSTEEGGDGESGHGGEKAGEDADEGDGELEDEPKDEALDELMEDVAEFDDSVSEKITDAAAAAAGTSEYIIWTKDFDRIEVLEVDGTIHAGRLAEMEDETRGMVGVMQKDLERMIAAKSRRLNVGGFRSGRMHSASLHRVVMGDDRAFRRRFDTPSKDVAIGILIDCSGSMRGREIETAATAGLALSQTLDRLNVAHEVLGFTTYGFGARHFAKLGVDIRQLREEEAKIGRPYSRWEVLHMPIIKQFSERLTPDVRRRFAALSTEVELCNNVDGECVEIAAWRLFGRREERKVLLVLSDGEPAADGNYVEQHDHLLRVVKSLDAKGVECVGIGIMTEAVRRYYPKSVVLESLEKLPTEVMKQLKDILLPR